MIGEPTVVLGSETLVMTARQSSRAYQISVSLPLGYGKRPDAGWPFNDTPERWPVVYVLDGNWYANMITDIVRPMAWCGTTTDAIVVGIGYLGSSDPIEAFRVTFTQRDYDLTPIPDEETRARMEGQHKLATPNGGAGHFLQFLQNELIPFIEGNYRADPAKRILLGHSYGGLFGLYSMLEAPELFPTIIMGSPTLSYRKPFMFEREEAFTKTRKHLPARVYLFVGELEESSDDQTLTDTLRLAALLAGRGYEGFSLVKRVFEDQGHCEVAAPGFQWGLKHALRR